jgi:hypothetical protein
MTNKERATTNKRTGNTNRRADRKHTRAGNGKNNRKNNRKGNRRPLRDARNSMDEAGDGDEGFDAVAAEVFGSVEGVVGEFE